MLAVFLGLIGLVLGIALFSDAEKAALRMAEAMCERSVTVSDEIFAEVRRHFEEKAIVEIAATIALENMRARFKIYPFK